MSTVFTFNSVTSTTMGLTVIDVVKPVMPPMSEATIDIPKRNGLIQSNKKFTALDITVKCILIGSSYSDLVTKQKALAGYMYSDTDKTLSFDDESDRYYNAQHIKTVFGRRSYRYAYVDLIFTCNDPFAYATSADTNNQTITSDDSTYTITNSGHYYAYPTITVYFNQAQTHIYIQNTTVASNRLDISKSFGLSDELVIDCKNLTVKLNGSLSPSGLGDGGTSSAAFPVLAVGSNTMKVGTDDATINVSVTVAFNKTYLY